MKNRKILAIILACVLVSAMTACGETKQEETAKASSAASAVSSETSAASSEESSAEAASSTSSASAVSETSEEENALEIAEEDEEEADVLSIPVVDEDLAPGECVELGEYKGLTVTDTYVAPTQEDVDSYVTSLLSPTEVEDENATVESGDTANIDYEGKIDGVAFDGGTSQGYDLVIGSGTFIPGFEDGVIGMKVGEEKDIDVTFPENYTEELAGKPAVFTVKVNAIKRTPTLDDAWVTEFTHSDYNNVEDFKAYIEELLAKNLKQQADSSMQYEAWQQVLDSSTVSKLPQSYVDRAAENFDKINLSDAEQYGMTLEDYLAANSISDEYYQQLKEAYAMDSAKNTIIVYAVWDKEGLTTDSEEYKETVQEVADTLDMTLEELNEEYGEDTIDNYGKTYAVLKRVLSYCKVVPAETAETSETSENG